MAARYGIGDLARETGTKPTTIRWYEGEGLLPPPARTEGGHRAYGPAHRDRLRFLRRARALGFDLAQVRALLDLADHPERPCDEANALASEQLASVEDKIARLQALRGELQRMVAAACSGNAGDCRVIECLADHAQAMS